VHGRSSVNSRSECLKVVDRFRGAGGTFVAWTDYRSVNYDIYAQHLSAAGIPLWTANGVPVCTAVYSQQNVSLALDGFGGLVLGWEDNRSGVNYDIYAQRLNAAGTPLWAANGVAICAAVSDQLGATVVADMTGGAIIAWADYRSGAGYDIYAQRVNNAGTPQWTIDGIVVCNAVNTQYALKGISNGAGGAIFAWADYRSGTSYDIYAQHLYVYGTAAWTAGGTAVCTATGDQTGPAICTDGNAGAIVAWADLRSVGNRDIYAQRIWFPGTALWTANGVAVCAIAGDQNMVQLSPDGLGGAIAVWGDLRAGYSGPAAQRLNSAGVAQWTAGGVLLATSSASASVFSSASDGFNGLLVSWTDYRGGSTSDTYAQRLNATGSPVWTAGGQPVNLNPSQDNENVICTDGAGGAIVGFIDGRNYYTTSYDLFASRVDQFGVMGGEPVMAGVKDVPNDQGGNVKVSWTASPLDLDPASYAVTSYLLFRSAPPNMIANALAAGRVTRSLDSFTGGGAAAAPLYAQPAGAQVYYWEFVGQQAAYHLPTYSLLAATSGDSLGVGNPRTAFMVQARNAGGTQWWNSPPDSGYSVDNIPPSAPAPFTGQYAAGTARLHWNPNTEPDVALYELHRGTSVAFVPGPGNLVSTQPDTGYADAAGAPYVYKLLAVDAHGNRSPVATLIPTGTLGVGDGAPAASFLAPPRPNPVRGGTTFTLGLARGGAVRLAIYDAQGRRVRVLLAGRLEAGEHRVAWDGRNDAGATVAPGLYLARLTAPGFEGTRRVAIVD
jgi:hypothetical protein